MFGSATENFYRSETESESPARAILERRGTCTATAPHLPCFTAAVLVQGTDARRFDGRGMKEKKKLSAGSGLGGKKKKSPSGRLQ